MIFIFSNIPKLHIRYKSAERKIAQKKRICWTYTHCHATI